MMKKLALIALLMGSTAQAVTVASSDGKHVKVPDDLAMLSGTLSDFMEDPGVGEVTSSIPVLGATGATLRLLIPAMQDLKKAQGKASTDTRMYDLISQIRFAHVTTPEQFTDVLLTAHVLGIELVVEAAAHRKAIEIHATKHAAALAATLRAELMDIIAKHYAILYKEDLYAQQLPGMHRSVSLSIDDLWELTEEPITPVDSLEITGHVDSRLDLSGYGLTSAHGLEKLLDRYPDITGLFLDNNRLTTLPDTIGNFHKLEVLFARNNQLTSLPDTVGNLKYLININLSNNQLTALPWCIGKLHHLRFLFLTHNQLRELPDSIEELQSLRWLDVQHNDLATLPTSFEYLQNLGMLYLDNNRLTIR